MAINIPHPNGNRAAQMANINAQIAQAAAINNAMKAGAAYNQPTQPLPTPPGPPTATTQRPPTKQQNTLTSPTLVTPNQSGFNYPGGNAPPPPASSQNTAQKAIDLQRRSIDASRQLLNALKLNASRTNRSLANIPSPGDIWVPFWILIFIFTILIPVGGHTRLAWLWLVIIGHAEIAGEVITEPQYGNGGSQGIIQGIIAAAGSFLGLNNSNSNSGNSSQDTSKTNTNSGGSDNIPSNWQVLAPPANGGLNIIPYLETANVLGSEGM